VLYHVWLQRKNVIYVAILGAEKQTRKVLRRKVDIAGYNPGICTHPKEIHPDSPTPLKLPGHFHVNNYHRTIHHDTC